MRLLAAACVLFVVATSTKAAPVPRTTLTPQDVAAAVFRRQAPPPAAEPLRTWAAARPKKATDTTPPTIDHVPPGACPRTATTTTTTTTTTAPATDGSAAGTDAPTPAATPAATVATGELPPCQVEATIVDDSGVFDPTLLYRLKGGAAFDRVAMRIIDGSANVYAAVVPAAVAGAGDVEYLIEAFDVEGNGPARAGTEARPLLLVKQAPDLVTVIPPPPPPVVEESNTGLIVAVVAGVALAAVAAVGVGVAVYALRPPANDVVVVNVDGPAPFTTLLPVLP